jgi:hypothetical protein
MYFSTNCIKNSYHPFLIPPCLLLINGMHLYSCCLCNAYSYLNNRYDIILHLTQEMYHFHIVFLIYLFILYFRPYERKSKENETLFKHLMSLPDISGYVEPRVLKELCAVAQLDKWTDEGCTGKKRSKIRDRYTELL